MEEQLKNKITCGDSLKIMKDIPDNSIDLVLTDPPYGMQFRSNYRVIRHNKIENDDNLDWLPIFSKEIRRVMKDNAHAYIFCSFHNIDIFKQALQPIKNILIWEKNNTGMGDLLGDYAPKYEMCIFISNGKKLNGNREPNIMKFTKTHNELHPTEKPTFLMQYLISKSSNENDLILDPFLGSGTTAVACKHLKRNFIGIEISEEYCEIARQRLRQDILI